MIYGLMKEDSDYTFPFSLLLRGELKGHVKYTWEDSINSALTGGKEDREVRNEKEWFAWFEGEYENSSLLLPEELL